MDIMNGVALDDNQCIVALDERGTGWIIARSEKYRATDVLPECSTEDNGFNFNWDKGLSVGLYLLTLRPWSNQSFDGGWDTGVDVVHVRPLWIISPINIS
jgi:hypothetical protein